MVSIIAFVRQYRIKKKEHLNQLETVDILHKKELLKTQTEIQKETMQHIGREIHDNVGQKLTLSSLYLQQLVYEKKVPDANTTINNINDIINESLNDLRHLSKSLTDDTITNYTLSELIKNECKKIQELKTYDIAFENKSKHHINSYQTKSIVFRVVQEFIQNSIKHAQCKKINIDMFTSETEIQMRLKDDGKGFDTESTNFKGIGLNNMKKRIGILKGSFNLESNKNGTTLTLKIPV